MIARSHLSGKCLLELSAYKTNLYYNQNAGNLEELAVIPAVTIDMSYSQHVEVCG